MDPAPWPDLPSPVARRQFCIEAAVVFAVFLLPSWCSAIDSWLAGPEEHARRVAVRPAWSPDFWYLVYGLQTLVPLCYVIARSGSRASTFGLRALRRWDVLVVAVLIAQDYVNAWPAYAVVESLGLGAPSHPAPPAPPARGTVGLALHVVAMTVSACAEELVFRAWFVSRVWSASGSVALAVVGSAVLFGATHLYQGAYGALHALVSGLVFALVFAWRRSLWPLVAAHALYDLLVT